VIVGIARAKGSQESIMFRGEAYLSLDSKGRLAVPSEHRDTLLSGCGGRLVVTADPSSKCLLIYPYPEWEPIEKQLQSLPSMNPKVQQMKRLVIGRAKELEMDGAGRILVPPPLRPHAGLEKNVVLVGQGNKFELWDEANWSEVLGQSVDFSGGDVPVELGSFSL
jgi:MraZ protein